MVPEGFAERHDLTQLFPGFTPQQSHVPDDALREDAKHWLFWREEDSLPENLLVLDTPDIDSEARINWERADHIRQCADVLVAILTQQKYNDAAVKEFFRKAASEAKLVLIVFNQCQLPDDEEYWPLWVGTFCEQTGIQPWQVYIAPNDRRAAEENRLPFYERDWPVDLSQQQDEAASDVTGHDLLTDLSQLHFADIKLQTLSGSLRQLCDEHAGVSTYLADVRRQSAEFGSAAELLSTHQLAEIDNWPEVPNALLVAEIRNWWATQREGWTAKVHGFYNTVGRGLTAPFRFVQGRLQGEAVPPIERYRDREWHAILDAVGKVYDKLTWMSRLGNELLRPRLDAILGGTSRAELLGIIERAHRSVDLEAELSELVSRELSDVPHRKPALLRTLSAARYRRRRRSTRDQRGAVRGGWTGRTCGSVGPHRYGAAVGHSHCGGHRRRNHRGSGGRDRHQRDRVLECRLPGGPLPPTARRIHSPARGMAGRVAQGTSAGHIARRTVGGSRDSAIGRVSRGAAPAAGGESSPATGGPRGDAR